ncbi:MAG TPA: hypothetical protein VM386_03985, partial [Acidimicrobiales bacterium]|nr:hypothetical protein [Acidimicrobiales bacterium]
MTQLNSTIVRNKGFPVKMAKVERVPDSDPPRWNKVIEDDETGDPATRTVWIRFDANAVADIEIAFGSTAAYQDAMEERAQATLRQALSLATGRPERDIGSAMLAEEFAGYLLSAQMAWSVAMGLDPTKAAEALEIGHRRLREEMAAAVEEMDIDELLGESTSASPSLGMNG